MEILTSPEACLFMTPTPRSLSVCKGLNVTGSASGGGWQYNNLPCKYSTSKIIAEALLLVLGADNVRANKYTLWASNSAIFIYVPLLQPITLPYA